VGKLVFCVTTVLFGLGSVLSVCDYVSFFCLTEVRVLPVAKLVKLPAPSAALMTKNVFNHKYERLSDFCKFFSIVGGMEK
jgi:hypothetical protein